MRGGGGVGGGGQWGKKEGKGVEGEEEGFLG